MLQNWYFDVGVLKQRAGLHWTYPPLTTRQHNTFVIFVFQTTTHVHMESCFILHILNILSIVLSQYCDSLNHKVLAI